MILTSYLYVGVHYRKNSGVSSKLATVVTLWIQVDVTNRCWKQWTVLEQQSTAPAAVNHIHLYQ
jgi:hypothetical protein